MGNRKSKNWKRKWKRHNTKCREQPEARRGDRERERCTCTKDSKEQKEKTTRGESEGRERGMKMPREHEARETYESEAALRALRGISQVAVSPTASTSFHPPSGCSATATASKNHVEFTTMAVASSFAAMPSLFLVPPSCRYSDTRDTGCSNTLLADIIGRKRADDIFLDKIATYWQISKLHAINESTRAHYTNDCIFRGSNFENFN